MSRVGFDQSFKTLAWMLLALLLLPGIAQAHRFAPSSLVFDQVSEDAVSVRWKTPIQTVAPVALEPQFPAVCRTEVESPWVQEGTGKLRQISLSCDSRGLVGSEIRVAGLAQNQSSVMVTVNLLNDISHQGVLTPDNPVFSVPEEPDRWSVVGRYTVLGAEHIWAGLDHLLFVLGLLLLVGRGRRLVWTITAFTVGHSVTLAMVTLGVFDYPVALIEFLIALSIFVLAVELTREAGASRLWRQPWWLAAGFGLLHGMGFAGALGETGLPQTNIPLALLFFNIGIEFGQLVFIALLLVAGGIAARLWQERIPALSQIPVLVLGSLSAMWCIERGLEVLAP